jgi:serine protease Do
MTLLGSDGIGFAIPIDTAIAVIRQLIANKCVVRPYVGMTINDFTEANNKRVSMRDKKGMSHYDISVIVMNVEKGSPAHKSGIERYVLFLSTLSRHLCIYDHYLNPFFSVL